MPQGRVNDIGHFEEPGNSLKKQIRVSDPDLNNEHDSLNRDSEDFEPRSEIGNYNMEDLLDTSAFLDKRHAKFASKKHSKIEQCKCDAEYHLALEAIKEQKGCGMIQKAINADLGDYPSDDLRPAYIPNKQKNTADFAFNLEEDEEMEMMEDEAVKLSYTKLMYAIRSKHPRHPLT